MRKTFPPTALVFDLDGTLYASDALLVPGYRGGLARLAAEGGPRVGAPPARRIRAELGQPVGTILRNLFPRMAPPARLRLADLVLAEFRRLIRARRGRLYPGALRLLRRARARRVRLALISNGRRGYVHSIARTHGLARFFPEILCAEDRPGRSKGAILREVLRRLRVPPERAWMVGDRRSDLEAAREAGTRFAGCAFGYGNGEELRGAELRARSLPELEERLLGKTGR